MKAWGMATYGYRLFTLQITDGMKRKPINFQDCDGERYADVASRLLKSLSVRTMSLGGGDHDDPDRAAPCHSRLKAQDFSGS